MSIKLIIILLLLIGGSLNQALADPVDKVLKLARAQSISDNLLRIASQYSSQDECRDESSTSKIAKDIQDILNVENDPDVLSRVAMFNILNMYPGRSEDQCLDRVFQIAWRKCIHRIEKINSPPSVDALNNIEHLMKLDASFLILVRKALTHLEYKLVK